MLTFANFFADSHSLYPKAGIFVKNNNKRKRNRRNGRTKGSLRNFSENRWVAEGERSPPPNTLTKFHADWHNHLALIWLQTDGHYTHYSSDTTVKRQIKGKCLPHSSIFSLSYGFFLLPSSPLFHNWTSIFSFT